MHSVAKLSEQVNRKCSPRNTTVKLSTPTMTLSTQTPDHQNVQHSTIGYLNNSWTLVYISKKFHKDEVHVDNPNYLRLCGLASCHNLLQLIPASSQRTRLTCTPSYSYTHSWPPWHVPEPDLRHDCVVVVDVVTIVMTESTTRRSCCNSQCRASTPPLTTYRRQHDERPIIIICTKSFLRS